MPLGNREGARPDEPESEDLLHLLAQTFGGKRAANINGMFYSPDSCFSRLPGFQFSRSLRNKNIGRI